MLHPSRRALCSSLPALAALSLYPRRALADIAASDRKLLFVWNAGGWDPLTVFAPLFDSPYVDLEEFAEPAEEHGIPFVDHPDRPSVRNFFEEHGGSTLLFRGVSVRSLSHEVCTEVALTGASQGGATDWGTRVSDPRRADFTLPHLVLAGPSFPGDRGATVARAGYGGQLHGLMSGRYLDSLDDPSARPSAGAGRAIDAFVSRRAAARRDSAIFDRERVLTAAFAESSDRASALSGAWLDANLTPGYSLVEQSDAAVDALRAGFARCVTISPVQSWDTHTQNNQQSALFEGLFSGLDRLVRKLRAEPGESAPTLFDETLVVVMSEMGRTPRLNPSQGRDHWPFTVAMCIGSGLSGGRVIGGWDAGYQGLPVDPQSGETLAEGAPLTAAQVGATVLTLAGVEPAAADGAPIRGAIA